MVRSLLTLSIILSVIVVHTYEPRPPDPEQQEAMASIRTLIPAFAKTERVTRFFGFWREGTLKGRRVGFVPGIRMGRGQIRIVTGEMDPDAEHWAHIYLSRLGEGEPLPALDSKRRLDPYLGPPGAEVSRRYLLNAGRDKDLQELLLPKIKSGLLSLSPRVREVAFQLQAPTKTIPSLSIQLRVEGMSTEELLEQARISVSMLKAWESAVAHRPTRVP